MATLIRKRPRSPGDRSEIEREALDRATRNLSLANYPTIFEGFTAIGIPAEQVNPRANVFTYHAWRALGRQVRRGEHGVRICTMIEMESRGRDAARGEEKTVTRRFPRFVTVFHVSQTNPVEGGR
jgi:antirestriction protein ArdC